MWADCKLATEELQKSSELESKKELYMAAMQTQFTKEQGGLGGVQRRHLADKAYPDLQEEARERLALNHYLSHLYDPQLGFSMRQSKPASVNEAVRTTLEMESYLQASIPATPTHPDCPGQCRGRRTTCNDWGSFW